MVSILKFSLLKGNKTEKSYEIFISILNLSKNFCIENFQHPKNFRNSIYFSLLKGNISIKFGYFLDKAGALLYNVRLLFETKGRALRQVLY